MNSFTLPRQILAALALYCGLSGPLWAFGKGQCKKNVIFSTTTELSFGSFASSAGGQVNVAYTGIRTTDAGTGVTLLGGTVRQGVFGLTEPTCADTTFSIILPADTPISDGTNTMTLTAFTSFPVGTVILDVNGEGLLQLGASLIVAYPQPPGVYSGSYIIEVVLQ